MNTLDESSILTLTDSYKYSHWRMYHPELQRMSSYFESRGGKFSEVMLFGLQAILKKYLVGQVVTRERIDEAETLVASHVGPGVFNRAGWEHILEKHGGRMPLLIKAVPEGMILPTRNALITVENTCIECAWVTNFTETLLVQAWYPSTVATLSHNIKKVILRNLDLTGTPSLVNFKLHDFGFRGVSSVESAGIGGMAHLVNFMGTDTVEALIYARNYYGADVAGFSIPAAEHSTIVSWLRQNESRAFRNALDQFPKGLLAVVSDTYDIYAACRDKWGTELRDKVMQREGTLVVRPDSGEPVKVVLEVLSILGEKFGTRRNEKGFKVLDDHVRVIQGDGVNLNSINDILDAMRDAGWSGDNIAFGMGGALLQRLDRDTQKFAFKASQVVIDAIPHAVWKDPVTDPGKRSKKGRLAVVRGADGRFTTVENAETVVREDLLQEVFYNGQLMQDWTWNEVKVRANEPLLTLVPPVVA